MLTRHQILRCPIFTQTYFKHFVCHNLAQLFQYVCVYILCIFKNNVIDMIALHNLAK